MPATVRDFVKGEVIFREGERSRAMYFVKLGQIRIYKKKGLVDIEFGVIRNGQILGEMAFFDGSPRSASAEAITNGKLIEIDYKSMASQYEKVPDWLKAIIRTMNQRLRDTNNRVKALEKGQGIDYSNKSGRTEEYQYIEPHTVVKFCAIIAMVTAQYGAQKRMNEETVMDLNPALIRNYAVQVFQEPASKLTEVLEVLQKSQMLLIENLEEDKQRLLMPEGKDKELLAFVSYYNEELQKDFSERLSLSRASVDALELLVHYSENFLIKKDGTCRANIIELQNRAFEELNKFVEKEAFQELIDHGLVSEMRAESATNIFVTYNRDELGRIAPYQSLIAAFNDLNITKREADMAR
jgi:CRP-like cAMP-binding protein